MCLLEQGAKKHQLGSGVAVTSRLFGRRPCPDLAEEGRAPSTQQLELEEDAIRLANGVEPIPNPPLPIFQKALTTIRPDPPRRPNAPTRPNPKS